MSTVVEDRASELRGKPLITREEINEAFPVHALFNVAEEKIKAAEEVVRKLLDSGIKVCKENEDSFEEHKAALEKEFDSFDPAWCAEDNYQYFYDLHWDCGGYGLTADARRAIWKVFGVDYDEFYREKDVMYEVLRQAGGIRPTTAEKA